MNTQSFAAHSNSSGLAPFAFDRRTPLATDIQIEILYCGVCHTDIHQVRNEWGGAVYPMVPGHEIVGRVKSVGNQVKSFKPGDLVGVGCMVNSCQSCTNCQQGLEQYCDKGSIFTYNSVDPATGLVTYGGYSTQIVVDHRFVVRVSDKLDIKAVAPLLCAGITTYSPLRHWKVGKGSRVGVVGLGGLGHMAVKLAAAMGAHVVLFTTSPGKSEDGERLGASEVVVSKDASQMKPQANALDFIIDTVAVPHDLDAYLALLKRDGTLCLVGVPSTPHASPNAGNLIFRRRAIAGSLIGGIAETQEMLDFSAQHNIVSEVEVIPMQKINQAFDRVVKSDVKYRFVIDLASIK